MQESYSINSPYSNLIRLKVTPGHFATTSSHINYLIDLTTLKARSSEAKAVAKAVASEYMSNTVVDTIICMDGTDVIGAYLADELTNSGIMCMNAHETIYIITPEQNSMGQLLFRDNVIPMVRGKHILVLLATATTGRTTEKAIECIEYYGGTIEGISAIFSGTESVENIPVHSVFHAKDIEGYTSYPSNDCPHCKAGEKLDGLITTMGYSNL